MKPTPDDQLETLRRVLESGLVEDWSIAVDGGANIGQWSAVLAEHFDLVHAFEPSAETLIMLRSAVENIGNVVVHDTALLDHEGRVEVISPAKRQTHRSRYVKPDSAGSARAITVDSMHLPSCGLLKLDLEGAECAALIGASETIRRCRPVLIVEVDRPRNGFKHGGVDTLALIAGFGYRLAFARQPDAVFVR